MISRQIESELRKRIHQGKLLVIIGPRQVGKTTLMKQVLDFPNDKVLWLNCDNPDDRLSLQESTTSALQALIGTYKLVVIDEAQRVPNIGLTLKIMADEFPQVQVIASGSSALDLTNSIKEPLTDRKREFQLYPISTQELCLHTSPREEKRLLEQRMIFGFYPEVINHPSEAQEALQEITNSYLYKEILSLAEIRMPAILQKLLLALALQVGSEVTFNDLGNTVGIDKETAEKYIDLLEKAFVIFRLNSFSRNMRRELKKSRKIYFWDNGIRNAIINNFNSLDLRTDKGALWENFLISERMKYLSYHRIHSNVYFWRTTTGKELDWLEEREGKLFAFEAKWNPGRRAKLPLGFEEAYPETEFQVVHRENYLDVLTQ
ncbi:ATP-binding protein [Algoriphagus sp. Y33]|uniref:ATP-binding protein n=1 Tax=Algoriphagus sp. Y33 TaxID=2772483 RepID=UPI0017852A48|nr:ATP-binding protein [Algoriphagus sp. Y33]